MPAPSWPVIEIVIEPGSTVDREQLGAALRRLTEEDRTFRVTANRETGQFALGGVSELQLDTKILRRAYHLEIKAGAPQVAYRETLGRAAEIDHTYKRQIAGGGEFARVAIRFMPGKRGSGYSYKSEIRDRELPRPYVLAVERGLYLATESGLRAGVPAIDLTATLLDGAYHDLDSSARAFEIAAGQAFQRLGTLGAPRLLEPVVRLNILAHEPQWRRIVGWLDGRLIQSSVETAGDQHVITGLAPLAKTFGLWRVLIGCSVHFEAFSIEFEHYVPVPTPDDDGPDLFPTAAALRA